MPRCSTPCRHQCPARRAAHKGEGILTQRRFGAVIVGASNRCALASSTGPSSLSRSAPFIALHPAGKGVASARDLSSLIPEMQRVGDVIAEQVWRFHKLLDTVHRRIGPQATPEKQ